MDLATRTFTSRSLDDTRALARALAAVLRPGDLLAFKGDLGAGKTTFIQGLVAALDGGASARVCSPTFAIINAYPTRPSVHHFDFYRLNDPDDLESTGFWDLLNARDSVIVVEWADRIPDPFDASSWFIALEVEGETQRRLHLTAPTARLAAIVHPHLGPPVPRS